jgi:hypothetical protein
MSIIISITVVMLMLNWVWAKNGYGDSIGFGGDAFPGVGARLELLHCCNSAINYSFPM